MTTSLNIGGTYKNLSSCGVNIGGTWKTVSAISANIGGVWKNVYNAVTYYMRIATSTTAATYCFFQKTNVLNTSKIVVFESAIKGETFGSTRGHYMEMRNGTKKAVLYINSGGIVCNYSGTSPYTYAMTTTTEHTYRMEFNKTTDVKFYVDGSLVHTATYANLPAGTSNYINIGDGDDTANVGGSFLYRTIRYNVDYEAAPANFVEWNSASLPTAQGWDVYGDSGAASIITV